MQCTRRVRCACGVQRATCSARLPRVREVERPLRRGKVDVEGRDLLAQRQQVRHLQPYVLGAATVRVGGCNRVHLDTCPLCT